MSLLGKKVRDEITGIEGTATARVEYLYGCVRYVLECPAKEGSAEEYTIDEQRLTVVEPPQPKPTATSGGDRQTPARSGLGRRR